MVSLSEKDFEHYLDGSALYGDDLLEEEIIAWYRDELEGYANLGSRDSAHYKYEYHAWNKLLAFDHLPPFTFERVLAFGAAYGDELLPIITRVRNVTIVEPSGAFVRDSVHGVPVSYVKPSASGALAFADGWFDLITCFGVLHHIPNISAVLTELVRILAPGGFLALREPIVSMGDWRYPRRGLTMRERGIPLPILVRMVRQLHLVTIRVSLCGFPLIERVFRLVRPDMYNSPLLAWVDAKVSAVFKWNVNYHPRSALERLRPTSVFMVLQKGNTGPLAPTSAGDRSA